MNNLSKRLMAIANLVDLNSSVCDIGTDHGYLSIYLTTSKNCNVIATDVRKSALDNAIKNINKNHLDDKIKVVLSDGLKNVDVCNIDTIIISGIGTHTILNILNTDKLKNINNLIIQSNNDLFLLRQQVTSLGYIIIDERVVFDYKYYVIIKFSKGIKKYSHLELKYGPILMNDNKDYYKYLYDNKLLIYDKLPSSNSKKSILKEELKELKELF